MWKPENRLAANRSCHRYPSDLTDAEWAIVAPMIPPARHGGRRRSVNVREVLNAIFYVLSTGCQWQALPKDLPPKSTAHSYLELWNWDGTLERIHHALYVAVREEEGREASPTVAIIDSQTAKGAQKGGLGLILSPSYSPKIAAWRDLRQDFARGAWRVDRVVRRLMTRRLGLILLGWKFRRGVGCGDGAALAMAL